MGSNIRFFLNKDEPLFLIFNEFHLKDIDNAPSQYAKWKVFCAGVSNLKGHFQIIYLETLRSIECFLRIIDYKELRKCESDLERKKAKFEKREKEVVNMRQQFNDNLLQNLFEDDNE
ncbi:uncharacterized protein LOC116656582 [Drosophila ananassae]|uniref:uncharacterized protein LOC116656582 n=1 Tax=Drosophila ananassae TaxID=7217 RepID=UPI001CFF7941|nr:uncharacterized protein LOC116656582 [Drosophila ananassae]